MVLLEGPLLLSMPPAKRKSGGADKKGGAKALKADDAADSAALPHAEYFYIGKITEWSPVTI